MQMKVKSLAFTAATASFVSSSAPLTIAFTATPQRPAGLLVQKKHFVPNGGSLQIPSARSYAHVNTRHYATSNKDEKSSNIITKGIEKLKSLNPFSSKNKTKSSAQITRKQQAKDEVSSSIDKLFQDAPLGVKMMGSLMKPLVGNLVGSLAQAVEEQQRAMDDVLLDAKNMIVQDSNAMRALGGGTIQASQPFSQSSSTVSINGKTESRIQASFQVTSSVGAGSGVATFTATNGVIDSLYLNVNGRNIPVDTRRNYAGGRNTVEVDDLDWKARKATDGLGKNHNRGKNDIIDAEFVDKKVNK